MGRQIDWLTEYINFARVMVERDRRIQRELRMGKLSDLADRIKDTKARLEAEADNLASKLDDIDALAPKAFERGHAFIEAQQAEVDEIDAVLRQLSNLPLERSAGLTKDSAPVVPVPKAVTSVPGGSIDIVPARPVAGYETAHTVQMREANK